MPILPQISDKLLRKYNKMLRAVRNGVFFPDLSRSGRFQDPPAVSNEVPVKVEDSGCESSGPASFDVVSQTVEEQAEALNDLERPEPLVTGRQGGSVKFNIFVFIDFI